VLKCLSCCHVVDLRMRIVSDNNNWGFSRGPGRGRPRGEFGGGDAANRRNVSEMVNTSDLLVST